jgi:hypothetical protein
LDQYEEYLLKKNNPDLDFVQISKIDDVSVNNVDKNLLADKHQLIYFTIPVKVAGDQPKQKQGGGDFNTSLMRIFRH